MVRICSEIVNPFLILPSEAFPNLWLLAKELVKRAKLKLRGMDLAAHWSDVSLLLLLLLRHSYTKILLLSAVTFNTNSNYKKFNI